MLPGERERAATQYWLELALARGWMDIADDIAAREKHDDIAFSLNETLISELRRRWRLRDHDNATEWSYVERDRLRLNGVKVKVHVIRDIVTGVAHAFEGRL